MLAWSEEENSHSFAFAALADLPVDVTNGSILYDHGTTHAHNSWGGQ